MLKTAKVKKLFSSAEAMVLIVIIACTVLFSLINPKFLSVANLFSLMRAGICNYVFALGTMLIMISGGVDMSFMAIGSLAMYSTVFFIVGRGLQPPMAVIFLLAAVLGLLCGFVNALFVHKIRLQPFIATLGTQNLFKGFVMVFLGTKVITNLPDSMIGFSKLNLLTAHQKDASISTLHASVLIVLGLCLLTAFILRFTMLGRSIYALGGDKIAAQRAGFNLAKTRVFIYGYAGALAGIGGVLSATLIRSSGPADLVGNELIVIAAVVLGGGNNLTGKGSVLGAILGVTMLTMVSNSLTLLHVSSFWQQALIGLIILVGLLVPTLRQRSQIKVTGGMS